MTRSRKTELSRGAPGPTFNRDALRGFRRARSYSQEELARRAGLAKRTIANLEAGVVVPRPSTLRLIAGALAIDPTELRVFPTPKEIEFGRQTTSASQSTASPIRPPTNLRRNLTSFVGRSAELSGLKNLVDGAALITLTGAGGTGKTRLATEFARAHLAEYPGGVWIVELATVGREADVCQIIAGTVHVSESAGQPLKDSLALFLSGQPTLLVLDNCEHVLESSRQTAYDLLRRCEQLTVLATSRERLNVGGEHLYRVGPFEIPSDDGSLACLTDSDAVRLFLDRAKAFSPNLHLEEDALVQIASLCRKLEGSPLAIELAVASLQTLSLSQLEKHVFELIDCAGTVPLGMAPHHASTQTMIEWSHELLREESRSYLIRLAIFPGRFNEETARAVLPPLDSERSRNLCEELGAKSLLEVETDSEGRSRYRMLETVRLFAARRAHALIRSADQLRFVKYFAERAIAFETDPAGPTQVGVFDEIDRDLSSYREALDLATSQPELTETGLTLLAALGRFWIVRGLWSEGRDHCIRLLDAAGSQVSRPRTRVELTAGVLSSYLADYAEATIHYRSALKNLEGSDDRAAIATTLMNLSVVELEQGETQRSLESLRGSVSMFRELDDRPRLGLALTNLAVAFERMGRLLEAKSALLEALGLSRELADKKGIAVSLNNLCSILIHLQEYDRAEVFIREIDTIVAELKDVRQSAYALTQWGFLERKRKAFRKSATAYLESTRLFLEIGDTKGLADALDSIGLVLSDSGSFDLELFQAIDFLRETTKIPRNPLVDEELADLLNKVEQELDRPGLAGRPTTWHELVTWTAPRLHSLIRPTKSP